jgi:Raf kinase inhibitor-like YbhB/YbcL family protein
VLARSCVTVLGALIGVVALGGCDSGDGRDLRPPSSAQRAAMTTTTSSTTTSAPAFPDVGAVTTLPGAAPTSTAAAFSLQLPWAEGAAIDARFTCDGEEHSPALAWTAPPAGTVEMALLVTDDDADGYVHWAVAGIPPSAGQVGEGATITGAVEGVNDFDDVGWGGPCPPEGEAHTYRFTLYALDQQAELPEDFNGDDLAAVAQPAALAVARATGTYTRQE